MNIFNNIGTFLFTILYYALYPFYYIGITFTNRFKK